MNPTSSAGTDALLDLLFELQSLDRTPRTGYAQRGVAEPESVSEHSFHVVFLVWALSTRVPGLDRLRAFELALIHDVAEVRFGDLPRPAAHYLPPGVKASAELLAMRDLLAPVADDGAQLFEEYQNRSSLEARFVAVCDKVQLVLKAMVYERWRSGDVEEIVDSLEHIDADGFEVVRELIVQLKRRRHTAG